MALQYSLISYSYAEAIVAYFLVLSEYYWKSVLAWQFYSR